MVVPVSLQLSQGEMEIAELFWDIGLRKHNALILVLMIRDVDFTSRDIERACDLRQPEVSIALTSLVKRKWIQVIREYVEHKGRPIKVYHLGKSLDNILEELKGEIIGDYQEKLKEIEIVRELLKSRG